MKDKWNSYKVQGDGIRIFKDKLKLLKVDLKVWNKEVFGHLETTKKELLKEIEDLDNEDENSGLEENSWLKWSDRVSKLRLTNKKLDFLLRQKARSNWLKHGDSNSKYYHSLIRWRRLRNEVKGVDIRGHWKEDPQEVRMEANKLFEERFSTAKDFRVGLGAVDFNSISLEDDVSLKSDISEEEIKEVVWQCDGLKSPRLDGFNLNFIKNSWEVLKKDILMVVRHFQDTGSISKGYNASFIAFVLKLCDPLQLEQYRPILLVWALYKIISKVLPLVIDENQYVFLKDRGKLDSVLIANEVIEDFKRSEKKRFMHASGL